MKNTKLKKQWLSRAAVFLGSFFCLTPIWADDTDIFFGETDNVRARPNILFIIDSSGSMRNYVDENGNRRRDPGERTRIDHVKEAFYTLLDELQNVNVGLMRFTEPGGPVLHQIEYIDAPVPSNEINEVTTRVAEGNDDAYELVGSGDMLLDRPAMALEQNYEQAASFYIDQVEEGQGDAQERIGSGSNSHSEAVLKALTYDSTNDNMIAVRFNGADIPKGSIVTNAFLRFTASSPGDGTPLLVRIYGEANDSGDFSSMSTGELASRTKTTNYADWNINRTLAVDETIDSSNITTIVQEIIEDADWDPSDPSAEDDMTFFLSPSPMGSSSGNYKFFSYDASSTKAPELYVEYFESGSALRVNSKVAFRFQNVRVPRGVVIESAHIQFTADRDFYSNTHNIDIKLEASGNSTTFSSANGDISSRSLVGSSTSWATVLSHSNGDVFNTPDLKDMVKLVTDRSDWCGGNAMSFVFDGQGHLPVWTYEGNASLAAKLVVRYRQDSVIPGSSCLRQSVTRSVASSSDDAEERGTEGNITRDHLRLENDSKVGLRFPDMSIPKGSTIVDARLKFTQWDSADGSGDYSFKVSSEAVGNAAGFASGDGTVEDRNYYATTEIWTGSDVWRQGTTAISSNLKRVITPVINGTDWASGNALSVKVERNSGAARHIKSYNGAPVEAPSLTVVYEDNGEGLVERRVRHVMQDIVEDLGIPNNTPIQDTLYEAALYYTGKEVLYGKTRGTRGRSDIRGSNRVSVDDSMVEGTYTHYYPPGCSADNLESSNCRDEAIRGDAIYKTPIVDACQKDSHIILLTDGQANSPNSQALIKSFTGNPVCASTVPNDPPYSPYSVGTAEKCVVELTAYLHDNDQSPLNGSQTVTTHTIGFNLSSAWLKQVAVFGGGTYNEVSTASELVDQIKQLVGEMMNEDSTFVAPVAGINQFNQLSHMEQLYFAIFKPQENVRWRGNLKRYALGGDSGSEIVDANNALAVNPETGLFNVGAKSFWSVDPDGNVTDMGGAASKSPAWNTRKLYTYYEGSSSQVLSDAANQINRSNSNLTKAMFASSGLSNTEFKDLLDWTRGKDVDNEDEDAATTTRYYYGDPLHSRPAVVTYGGDPNDPDTEVFFGTNAGVLHAVNAKTGVETFAYMPEALLPVQKDLRANAETSQRIYGMDGLISIWREDNGTTDIDTAEGDFVRLYTGMRRGGRNYYGLDVSDRDHPEILWTIKGGEVQSNGDDFSELGQSWSQPIKTRVLLDGETNATEVLIFSGGYNEDQDDALYQTEDGTGRAMYIVNAETGELVWSGGKTGQPNLNAEFSDMKWSFPATPAVIDIDLDGLADGFFIGDMGGQLWRFDIRNGQTPDNLVTGGVIADLGVAGGANTIEDNRRFFASPTVSLVRGPQGLEMAVVIGSGFRPSPLSTLANNRMFMIRQHDVLTSPGTYTKLTVDDLYDASENKLYVEEGVTLTTAEYEALLDEKQKLAEKDGWYFNLNMNEGEKVMSSALVVDDQIVFTTYVPGSSADESCTAAAGRSYSYSAGLEDAAREGDPSLLSSASIYDRPTVTVSGENKTPDDPNSTEEGGTGDPGSSSGGASASCKGGTISVKLNMEDGPVESWCNSSTRTFWQKVR